MRSGWLSTVRKLAACYLLACSRDSHNGGYVVEFINQIIHGDIVLDPFAGSSTTAVACIELGRRFICIEEAAQYVAVSKTRIEQAAAQTNLFKTGAQDNIEAGETAYNSRSLQCGLEI